MRFLATVSGVSCDANGGSGRTPLRVDADAQVGFEVVGFGITFEGVSPTDEPVLVKLYRPTNSGTMDALTLVKANDDEASSIAATGKTKAATSPVEPTVGDVLWQGYVHPQVGLPGFWFQGFLPKVSPGDSVAILAIADDTVNAAAWMACRE